MSLLFRSCLTLTLAVTIGMLNKANETLLEREQELVRMYALAEGSAKAKSSFLAAMSHEFVCEECVVSRVFSHTHSGSARR
jgi:hypothetical protein